MSNSINYGALQSIYHPFGCVKVVKKVKQNFVQ